MESVHLVIGLSWSCAVLRFQDDHHEVICRYIPDSCSRKALVFQSDIRLSGAEAIEAGKCWLRARRPSETKGHLTIIGSQNMFSNT